MGASRCSSISVSFKVRAKPSSFMDGTDVPFSNLGASFMLPSMMREEIDQLKMLVRDLSIEMHNNLGALKREMEERIEVVEESIGALKESLKDSEHSKQLLDARLDGIKDSLNNTSDKLDEFSAYSYFDPHAIVNSTTSVFNDEEEESGEIIEVTRVKGFIAPDPESDVLETEEPTGLPSLNNSEEVPLQKNFCWWEELDDAAIAVELVSMIDKYIDEFGAVLNNQVGRRVYPEDLELTKSIKDEIKNLLANDNCPVSSYRVDKFRVLYHKGEDGDEEYRRRYGKNSSES